MKKKVFQEEIIKSLKEIKKSIDSVKDSTFFKEIKDVSSIVYNMTGISDYDASSLNINGVDLEVDYREEELYNKEKMVRIEIIRRNGSKSTKYTRKKNLTADEKKQLDTKEWVLIVE